MATDYLLDAEPLGLLAHSRVAHRVPIQNWLMQEMLAGLTVYVSEIADYEVRRELTRLVRAGQIPASRLNRLDRLTRLFHYLPVATAMWRRAADFWAEARLLGMPTAGAAALDADVLVAAQAAGVGATVVTGNPGHIGRWVPVRPWP
jgi:predicted nucleic acid-binding protein